MFHKYVKLKPAKTIVLIQMSKEIIQRLYFFYYGTITVLLNRKLTMFHIYVYMKPAKTIVLIQISKDISSIISITVLLLY